LFTVLGEFVLPSGGAAWTATFIDVLDRLGVAEKAARQALMRTAADGWLDSRRVGRHTCWTLTADAHRLLTEGTERIYGFTGQTKEWDGEWLLVLARAPETDRPARHVLRTRLTWAGFGSPASGVWASPHTERLGEVERVLASAGLAADAHVFRARYAQGEQAALVRQAWDLDAVELAYQQFRADVASAPSADPLARVVGLVHAWRRFPWIDPALPAELLPARWSGRRAAADFRRLHARWTAAAHGEWRRIDRRQR
jgi:phenylacetic acid degradation operon negative regulatory protein